MSQTLLHIVVGGVERLPKAKVRSVHMHLSVNNRRQVCHERLPVLRPVQKLVEVRGEPRSGGK